MVILQLCSPRGQGSGKGNSEELAGQRPGGQVKVLWWHPLYWGVSLPSGDALGQGHELPEPHSLLHTSCEVCAFSWG